MGSVTRKIFEERARELNAGQVMLETVVGAMLAARTTLQTEYTKLHKSMSAIVRDDDVCRRLMTAPGVGPVVAITFKKPWTTRSASRSRKRWAPYSD